MHLQRSTRPVRGQIAGKLIKSSRSTTAVSSSQEMANLLECPRS